MNAPMEILLHGSPEWALARCGNACVSEFGSILAKGKEGRMRRAYLRRVLGERLTGKPAETYSGKHTERGLEQEPLARDAYEAATGELLDVGPFLRHPTIAAVGTPDGLISSDGGVEIKSVIPTVQIDTLLRGDIPPEHRPQVQGYLWLSGRRWWDFCSFCADMREDRHRLCVYRVLPDEKYMETLQAEVCNFLNEVDRLYAELMDRSTLLDKLVARVDANSAGTQA